MRPNRLEARIFRRTAGLRKPQLPLFFPALAGYAPESLRADSAGLRRRPPTATVREHGRFRRPAFLETGMNILVIGGAGYIGSCTSKALAEAGHRVRQSFHRSQGSRQMGPAFRGRHSRRREPARVSAQNASRRHSPFRRLLSGGRIRAKSRQVLPQQRGRDPEHS